MKSSRAQGFTLIELMVSMAIFALVMMLVSGAYLEMIAVTDQAQAVATATDNLSYALESMARSLRTGSGYACSGTCTLASSLTFTDEDGNTITYQFTNNTIKETYTAEGSSNSIGPVSIIDPTITITQNSGFVVAGNGVTDGQQPQVEIIINGTIQATPRGNPVNFTMETSATERSLDLN